jgi:hypothetical protein
VDVLTFLVANGCGSSEDGTREGEERKSLDSVHFDVGDVEYRLRQGYLSVCMCEEMSVLLNVR